MQAEKLRKIAFTLENLNRDIRNLDVKLIAPPNYPKSNNLTHDQPYESSSTIAHRRGWLTGLISSLEGKIKCTKETFRTVVKKVYRDKAVIRNK